MNKAFLIVLLYLMPCLSIGQQNLVPNGSFEDQTSCPNTPGAGNHVELAKATGWFCPTAGSSDLFDSCATSTSGVNIPNNLFGEQVPHSGTAYAGFGVFSGNRGAPTDLFYTEYVAVKLNRVLKPNEHVKLRFFLNLSGKSTHAVSNINAILTENSWDYFSLNSSNPIDINGQFTPLKDTLYSDTSNWMLWEGEYTSIGCEEYLTIGYFNDTILDSIYLHQSDPMINAMCYFYIDSVSMYSINTQSEEEIAVPNVFTPNNDGIGDEFRLADIGKLEIYDRWGKLVSINETAATWDGTDEVGNQVTEGTYYYIWSKYRGVCNEIDIKKGFVQVFR